MILAAASAGFAQSPEFNEPWKNPNVALAIDPFEPDTIYCGTGESNMSADTYPGSGIYVSRDRANNWEVLNRNGEDLLPRRVAALTVHPYIPGGKVIYLGGIAGATIVAVAAGAVGVEPGADPAMRSSYYGMLIFLAAAVAAVLGLLVVAGGYLVGRLVRRLRPETSDPLLPRR